LAVVFNFVGAAGCVKHEVAASGNCAAGWSVRAEHVNTSRNQFNSAGSASNIEEVSLKRKRGRSGSKPNSDDFEFSQVADVEERKLAKRRAKNRRTAQLSRERKQTEMERMKAELQASSAEVARLQQIVLQKDQQIARMMGVSSTNTSATPVIQGQWTKSRASESAELTILSCS
jgi:translation elongation factor P/translation initiation factor 5A